jgi:flagellar biogenesis protein FliO
VQALSVLIVFALLGAALWALRPGSRLRLFAGSGSGSSRKTRSLEQVEKLMLTPQHAVHLIRVAGREVIVATHPQGCTLIQAMPLERGANA